MSRVRRRVKDKRVLTHGDLVAAEDHEGGRTVVLVLDEARLLGADQLEELRLRSNADTDSHSPFPRLLVGQPTLPRRHRLGIFAAIDQRIALRYAMTGMTGMNPQETRDYVGYHLKLAGRSDTLSATTPLALIHQVSRWPAPGGQPPRDPIPGRRLRHQQGHRRPIQHPRRSRRSHDRMNTIPPT